MLSRNTLNYCSLALKKNVDLKMRRGWTSVSLWAHTMRQRHGRRWHSVVIPGTTSHPENVPRLSRLKLALNYITVLCISLLLTAIPPQSGEIEIKPLKMRGMRRSQPEIFEFNQIACYLQRRCWPHVWNWRSPGAPFGVFRGRPWSTHLPINFEWDDADALLFARLNIYRL